MNTKQTKREFIALKVIALTLSLLVLAGVALYCFTTRPGTYTVYADDGYYSETTYYLTDVAYERGVPLDERISLGEENDFTLAVQKDVWVYESTDENGVVTESRLLGKEEAEQAKALSVNATMEQVATSVASITPIGEDSESYYRFSAQFYVGWDNDKNVYTLHGSISWENLLASWWEEHKAAEEDIDDYLGFTWEGGFLNSYDLASAKYYNDQKVEISTAIDDRYKAQVWQFREKSGWMGRELEQGDFYVDLSRTSPSQGRPAMVQMTYIHTYGKFDGSVSLKAGIDEGGISSGIGLAVSTSEDNWQIQMGIVGLEY